MSSADDYLAFITSIENDDVETTVRILAERFDKKFLQPVGVLRVTAAQLAAWKGNIELLDLLYEKRPDINATDKIGRCALFHAAHRGNAEVVNWLLAHGASTETRSGVEYCYKNISSCSLNPCFIGRNVSVVIRRIFHLRDNDLSVELGDEPVAYENGNHRSILLLVTHARVLGTNTLAPGREEQSLGGCEDPGTSRCGRER